MAARIKLDTRGIGEIAKSPMMRAEVREAAEKVAENVRSMGIMVSGVPGTEELPVKVTDSTTDRAVSRVTIAHPAGQAVQAKHGALTKAAVQAGLKVRAK